MRAYGQVKGRKYTNQQPVYVPPEPKKEVIPDEVFEKRQKLPVICDGKRYESITACARAFECQPSTIRDHLNRGTLFRGHTLVWDFREGENE